MQVKTFVPGTKTCSVGAKAEVNPGKSFFWVLAGLPDPHSDRAFEYYIVPAADMAKNVGELHRRWLATPGKKGQAHKDNTVRAVAVAPGAAEYFSVRRCPAFAAPVVRDRGGTAHVCAGHGAHADVRA